MAETIIIPTPYALSQYNLDRHVRTSAFDGKKNNPFVTVNGEASVGKSEADTDNNFFMNEVILEAFEYQPVRVTTKPVNGMVQASLDYGGNTGKPSLLATFRLLLDNDKNVSISYSHTWSTPAKSLLTGLYKDVNGIADKVAFGTTIASNGLSRIGSGEEFKTEPIKRIDYQKVYETSKIPDITVNFTAFTNDNFIGDIYVPVMALCAFTHPKRFTGEKDESSSEEASKWEKTLSAVSSALGTVTTATAEATQTINETLALTARQYTLKPPCLFNLYHQSGFYTYSNCMCTNIKVDYEGPWYNATNKEQQIFDVLSKGPMKLNINRRSFPTVARVSMTFTPNEVLTRDDFHFITESFRSIADKGTTTFTKNGTTT